MIPNKAMETETNQVELNIMNLNMLRDYHKMTFMILIVIIMLKIDGTNIIKVQ
jgi:hypothetical protein